MSTKFGNRRLKAASLRDQRRDPSSKAAARRTFFRHSIPQNLPDLLLHAVPVAPGTALQPFFDRILKLTHHELRHDPSPKPTDIMISLACRDCVTHRPSTDKW